MNFADLTIDISANFENNSKSTTSGKLLPIDAI